MFLDFSKFSELIYIILSTFVLGSVSILLFYWFKSSNAKKFNYVTSSIQTISKKKIKKKVTIPKLETHVKVENVEIKKMEEKHIEINNSPEIFNIDESIEAQIHSHTNHKPILKNNTDTTMISEETVSENIWDKIPKDEILRSRQSSVTSDVRCELKKEDSKPTKNQRKRLKAKLKALEVKRNERKFHGEQENNSAQPMDSMFIESLDTKEDIDEKICRLYKNDSDSKTELTNNDSKIYSSDKENDDFDGNYDFAIQIEKPIIDFRDKNCIHNEEDLFKINSLVEEIDHYKQEIMSMRQTIGERNSLAAANEKLEKDNDNLERTLNSMKNELANSVRNENTAKGRISRLMEDINIYEAHQKSMKTKIDQTQLILADKEQTIKVLNNEKYIMKQQMDKKKMEYEDLESKYKNLGKRYKDSELNYSKFQEDYKRMKFHLESLENQNMKVTQAYQDAVAKSKMQETEQNTLISNLQYQIDDLQREKQQLIIYDNESGESDSRNKNSMLNYQAANNKNNNVLQDGQEMIDSSKISQLTSIVTKANHKLKEVTNKYDLLLSEKSEKENLLILRNQELENKYQLLNADFETHLVEIINLRRCIETLQDELSKTPGVNSNELRQELLLKSDTLKRTEEILSKLENAVEEEANKWKQVVSQLNEENERLIKTIEIQKSQLPRRTMECNESN